MSKEIKYKDAVPNSIINRCSEEEFILATQPINPELEELETQIRSETVIAMYLMDQLNAKKKVIHGLYKKERTLKSKIVERSRKRK